MSYSSLIITFLLDTLHKVQKKLRKKIRFAVRSQPMKLPSHFYKIFSQPVCISLLFTFFPFPSLLLASPLTPSLQFLSSLLSFPCFSSPLSQSNHFLSYLHISFLPFLFLHFLLLHFLSLLCYVQYGHLLYTLYALLIIASLFVELPTVLKVQLL